MKRILLTMAAVLAIGACSDAPTNTTETPGPDLITDGKLDGNAHPAVVLIIADVGGAPAWRCSGTLIAPTIVLTAGHCTEAPGVVSGMRIFTESDVQNGNNNYPFAGPNTVEAKKWATHPDFPNAPFFVNDVGLMQLKNAVTLSTNQYGRLPQLDQLDALKPSNSTRFTAVGYGLQKINPVFVEAERIRMSAEPHLLQINVPGFTGDFSLLLSNNASTGGTCFGDSGGPNYLGSSNVVAGVTSFGINGNCAGTGGVFRMDRKNVLDFVRTQLKAWKVALP
jgi:V8-like Glu-specific endopeptidase